jgi:D-tyrosyl-tRNA(Tyr) deacylase
MKIVLQRVQKAAVEIDHTCVGKIGKGYVLLLGLARDDTESLIVPMIEKLLKIKLFSDEQGRFSHSLVDIGGAALVISQFTLFADLKKGKKPSLSHALLPEEANKLYEAFIRELRAQKIPVETGVFGAYMQIHIQNDGPVTIILDSKELFPSLY